MTTRYFGKVCAKHPSLKGERCSAGCVACAYEASKRYSERNRELLAARARERMLKPEVKAKAAAASTAYYQANAEALKAKQRERRHANPLTEEQKIEAQVRAAAWQKANRSRRREIANRWGKTNVEARRAATVARRATKLNATPAWADKLIIEEAYRLAKLREKLTGINWHVDHIVPLRSKLVCGLHCEANLRVVPATVNQGKGNRFWPDMP